ncbi:hypothetical protein N658DRAFT_5280 [Parathielavia hyrcaniae]|uniref:Uncharacterized protein n=1 Tax=Parathielavia hyrcaniae TaxID=113614 RepID=A0AAN6T5L9_9PEZI|nr:hypothetical protein N658DRAFT_5280 [Parathielavia hyrcaniae]
MTPGSERWAGLALNSGRREIGRRRALRVEGESISGAARFGIRQESKLTNTKARPLCRDSVGSLQRWGEAAGGITMSFYGVVGGDPWLGMQLFQKGMYRAERGTGGRRRSPGTMSRVGIEAEMSRIVMVKCWNCWEALDALATGRWERAGKGFGLAWLFDA